MAEKGSRTPKMFRKLFSRKNSKLKDANASPSSCYSSAEERLTDFQSSGGEEDVEMHGKLVSEKQTLPVAVQTERIFEEPNIEDQKEALALTLLDQHQRQRQLTNKLTNDQKCVIIMQGELRATLKENKQLERKIKSLEKEVKDISENIKREMVNEAPLIYTKLQQKLPDVHKRLVNCTNKTQLAAFIRVTSDLRETLGKAERLAKIKYFGVHVENTSPDLDHPPIVQKVKPSKGFVSRKKIIAKRHHPVPKARVHAPNSPFAEYRSPGTMDVDEPNTSNENSFAQSRDLYNRINTMLSNLSKDS